MRMLAVAVSVLLSGCASNSIVSYVDVCCPEAAYTTFSVEAKNIPAFLGPIMVSNFSVALAARGLQPVESDADLLVRLSFEQEDLTAPRPGSGFDERISPGGDVRFVARMVIEAHDTKSGELVWSGGVHRLHDVSPGEYMHTGRASIDLLDASSRALSQFPVRER